MGLVWDSQKISPRQHLLEERVDDFSNVRRLVAVSSVTGPEDGIQERLRMVKTIHVLGTLWKTLAQGFKCLLVPFFSVFLLQSEYLLLVKTHFPAFL